MMAFKKLFETLLLAGSLILSGLFSQGAAAAEYGIAPSHTFIEFEISHLGYSVLSGRFNTYSGSFNWDADNPAASSINITIKTNSIDTNWAERDKHLRSADFLDVETYPEASFKSTKYSGDANGGRLDGVLTLHGVSKPITLQIERVGEGKDPWGGYRAGFKGTTSLKRADFGISYNLGPAAETMQFHLFVEGVRKQ